MQILQEKLILPTQTGLILTRLSEIIYCQGDRNYTLICLQSGKKIQISKILSEFENVICESDCNFYRIHKSYLINLDFVSEYWNSRHNKVILLDKTEIPVSTRRIKQFYSYLKQVYLTF